MRETIRKMKDERDMDDCYETRREKTTTKRDKIQTWEQVFDFGTGLVLFHYDVFLYDIRIYGSNAYNWLVSCL